MPLNVGCTNFTIEMPSFGDHVPIGTDPWDVKVWICTWNSVRRPSVSNFTVPVTPSTIVWENQWNFVFATRIELWVELTVRMKFEMLKPFSHIVPFSHPISPGWICSNPNCLNVSASKMTPSWRSPLCNRITAGSNSVKRRVQCADTIFLIQFQSYFPRPRLRVQQFLFLVFHHPPFPHFHPSRLHPRWQYLL